MSAVRRNRQKQYYDLKNGEVTANGKLFKGWAGPISAAFGAAWRKETVLQTTPNPANEYPAFLNGQLIGNTIPTQPTYFRGVIPQGYYINQSATPHPWPAGAPVNIVNGKQTGGIPGLYYVPSGFLGDANSSTIMFSSERTFSGDTKVKEVFTEFNVPLLKDVPSSRPCRRTSRPAGRTTPAAGNVWAWKAGLDWAINDSFGCVPRVRETCVRPRWKSSTTRPAAALPSTTRMCSPAAPQRRNLARATLEVTRTCSPKRRIPGRRASCSHPRSCLASRPRSTTTRSPSTTRSTSRPRSRWSMRRTAAIRSTSRW